MRAAGCAAARRICSCSAVCLLLLPGWQLGTQPQATKAQTLGCCRLLLLLGRLLLRCCRLLLLLACPAVTA
jgi:hypothetical protein